MTGATWCDQVSEIMEKRLLNILRCPITHKGLSMARQDTLSRVNQAIESGQLSNREGNVLTCLLYTSDAADE